jgi:ketosteroid isomerase-like protein
VISGRRYGYFQGDTELILKNYQKMDLSQTRRTKMAHKTCFVLFLIGVITLSAAGACRLGAPSAAPESSATEQLAAAMSSPVAPAMQVSPTLTPTETLAPSDTPQPATPEREGAWYGLTSQGLNFEIDVKGDQVVFFNVWYKGQKGSCGFSGAFGDSVEAPVIGDQFTIDWKDSDGNEAHIAGKFTSDSQARGSIDYIDNVKEVCDKSMHLSWSALSPAAFAAGTPIAPPATLPVSGLNGRWEGENSDGHQVLFDVSDDQIAYVSFNFSVHTGDCSISGFMGEIPEEPVVISEKSFSVELKREDDQLFTFAGSFTSDTESSGTIHMQGAAGASCAAFDDEMTWAAQKSIDQGGSELPTETATQSSPATPTVAVDSMAVVVGFFDAYNAGNIDAAVAFVEDRIMFTLGSGSGRVGKENLKAFLTEQQQKGVTFTISNLKVIGDIVKFSALASDGTAYPGSQAFTDAGKITLLTLK